MQHNLLNTEEKRNQFVRQNIREMAVLIHRDWIVLPAQDVLMSYVSKHLEVLPPLKCEDCALSVVAYNHNTGFMDICLMDDTAETEYIYKIHISEIIDLVISIRNMSEELLNPVI